MCCCQGCFREVFHVLGLPDGWGGRTHLFFYGLRAVVGERLWICFLLIVIQSACLFWSSFLAAVSCSGIAFCVSGLIGGTIILSKRAERIFIK